MTKKAASVILIENGIKREAGSLPAEGSLVVTPTRDTTYRLEVADRAGRIKDARVDVTVEPFGAPRIESFTATPSVVARGDEVSLGWKVAGADSLEIVSELGGRIALISPATTTGSYTVSPTDSTKYGLRARNSEGVVTAEVEVTVARRPTVSLEISSSEASYGDELTLTWTVAHADTLVIFDPRGELIHEGPASNGSLVVEADRTGSYRATALGMGGEEHAYAHVEIDPIIEEFVVVAQGEMRPGGLALASWKVKGAERVVISNGVADLVVSRSDEDSSSVKMATGGAFILRAYSGSKVVEKSVAVRVIEEPLIRRLSAGALVTAGQGIVGRSTIGWEVDGASKLLLEVEPGGVVDLTDKSPRLDEVDVLFRGPGTVTLTAYNGAGSTTMVIPSPVDPVPTIEDLFAAPSRAGMGEPVEIHWATRDGHRVILERDGVELPVEEHRVSDKHLTQDPITGTTTFVLRVFNTLGHEVVSDPLVVETGAPNQLVFTTTDGQRLYRVGTDVELVWENDGGTSLTVTNTLTGKQVCSNTDWAQIRKGTCIIKMPEEQQEVPLVLEVRNDSGFDTQELNLRAVEGPIILSFTPEFESITEGDSLLFFWEALADANGNIPTLELVDDRGNEYDMSDVVGDAVLMGSKRFRVYDWGAEPRTFTLTATSPVPPAYSLTADLMVYGIPSVDEMSASPPFAVDEGDVIHFSVKTTHGTDLELFHLAEDGSASSTPFFSTIENPTDAQLCSFSDPRTMHCTVPMVPTIAQPHVRAVSVNPLGVRTPADFRIGVSPASVSIFTANGKSGVVDVLRGEEVTLEWKVERADDSVLREGFVDISQRPNAVKLVDWSGSTTTTLRAGLFFPEGFVFPYDGEEFTAVQVHVAGYLTFDMTATGTTSNIDLPFTGTAATQRAMDIAPFWDAQRKHVIWYEHVEAEVDYLVIQWTNGEFSTTTANPSSLNFQVVLFEDGRFEFHYGPMDGANAASRANSATIGAQSFDCASGCAYGNALVFNSEQKNGLEGRIYRFNDLENFDEDGSTPVPMTDTGTMRFVQNDSRVYTLHAWNGHSEHTETLEVRVHDPAELQIWTDPADPLPGDHVTLHWSGKRLSSLSISDEAGNPIHTASPDELASGWIDLGVLAQGIYRYDFQGVGPVAADRIDRRYAVSVNAHYDLVDFSASSTFIKKGESVTLTWSTINADSLKLIELPSGIEHVIPPEDFATGSRTFDPQVTTTYVLEMESAERHRTAEQTVEVRSVWINDFSVSKTRVLPGESIDLAWDTKEEGTITLDPLPGMAEVNSPFEDISHLGASLFNSGVDTSATSVVFPAGFTFPYYGQEHVQVRVAVDGFISFDPNQSSIATNTVLPNTAQPNMHIAPFWDDLHTGTNGKVVAAFLPNPDRFIVQWSNFHRFAPSDNRNWNLNFQVVLFRDGTFEYRYGAMDPPPGGTTTASSCTPGHCQDEANGSSATIGFQAPGGREGVEFHFGGTSTDNFPAFPGGLAGRSFRVMADPEVGLGGTGTIVKSSDERVTYTLCISDDTWEECREEHVDIIRAGDLLITEVMPRPTSGGAEWIEIRNLRSYPFDLDGLTLSNGTDTFEFTSSLVVPANGYVILASADDPAVRPDFIYTGWGLGGASGSLSLEFDGLTLHSMSWENADVGASLQVPGHQQTRAHTATAAADLCAATSSYGGGSMGTPGAISDCRIDGYLVDFYSDKPFIDIRATGTEIPSVNADTAAATIPGGIGFTMPYFSGTVSDLWVNSNGIVGFSTSTSTSASNRNLPTTTTSPNGIIAAFWDDNTFNDHSNLSKFQYERLTIDNMQVTILQWSRFKRWNHAGEITFQVQLWENGDIVIAFDHFEGNHMYQGASATIGIEGLGGSPDIQFLFEQPILKPYQSLLFAR